MTNRQLKTLRKQLGLTQAQLGEQLGVTQSTVKKWEMGLHPINPTAQIILRQMKTKPAHLPAHEKRGA